ncbi:MAG TPA: pyridoxal phosphate-dependent aminotransferase [Candidatus Acidoferrales bacterium]|nr:pyridoxal phosphate-dependent aminotransferase [Candidatus Acidoferrales bacterium]
MQLSERIERITESSTLAVMVEAEKYKARGVDVVDFGPGEPDFPTPDHIKRAAIRALEQNFTKYTPAGGVLPLRQAICEWHGAQLGTAYKSSECAVTVGGKHAIFNTVNVLVNSGDEVVIPVPCWVSFPDIVKYAGGKPVFVETRQHDGFCLHARDVEAALTPKTRMVIVNSPSNPTGAILPDEQFAQIAGLCRSRGIWLLTDECYSHFLYGGRRPFSAASLPDLKGTVIVCGSLSKTFAMTGWRIGFVLAPEPIARAVVKLQSQSTSNPTSIAQHAALEAVRGPMDSVAAMLAEYERRRARVLSGLRAIPGLACTEPQGAFYAFPNVSACRTSDSECRASSNGKLDTAVVARRLLESAHVAVVPGEGFGAPGYFRLSYATSIERIEEGLRRLTEFFSES